jgi:quercetin dioxygenase-like cupin family protein
MAEGTFLGRREESFASADDRQCSLVPPAAGRSLLSGRADGPVALWEEIRVTKPLIVQRNDAARALNVVGEQITVLASGAQTGSYEIFHQAGAEGSGPPPHSHAWDEAFYVTKGRIVFGVGDHEAVASPGTLVHVPAGTMHWFRFEKGGGEMVSMTSREGASHLFADLDREISPSAPDPGKLAEVANRHGLTVAAPKG